MICSVKHTLTADSCGKVKVGNWAWVMEDDLLGDEMELQQNYFHFSYLCSSSFLVLTSVLDKEPLGLKVLAKVKINCSEVKGSL